jgi:hypothetical protein
VRVAVNAAIQTLRFPAPSTDAHPSSLLQSGREDPQAGRAVGQAQGHHKKDAAGARAGGGQAAGSGGASPGLTRRAFAALVCTDYWQAVG